MRIEFLNVWSGETGRVLRDYLLEESRRVEVFCFQKVDKKFPAMAEKVLANYGVFTGYKFINENDFFPQATYVRNGIAVTNARTILENIPDVGLGLVCQLGEGRGMISLANIHGISRPGNKLDTEGRIRQSEAIIEHYANADRAVIIGGDFNLEKEIQAVRMFAEAGYENLIEKHGVRTTRNRLIWERYPKNRQYFSDYVFVRGIKVKYFEVLDNEVSDHLPMILEVD